MQTHTRILPIACFLVLAPITASAEGWYVEGIIGVDSPDELEYFDADDLSIPTIGARAGYQLNKFLSVEGDLRIGVQDDDSNLANVGGEAEIGLTASAAIFARASLPLSERLSTHVRLGTFISEYSVELTNVAGTGGSGQYTTQPAGLAVGAGAEFDLSEDFYLRTDYTLFEFPGTESDALTVGVGVKF